MAKQPRTVQETEQMTEQHDLRMDRPGPQRPLDPEDVFWGDDMDPLGDESDIWDM